MRCAALLLALVVAGCAAPLPPPPPVTLVWSHDLAFGADQWRVQAEHRFGHDAVVVVCHGSGSTGEWLFVPDPPRKAIDVQAACELLRAAYPGRPIVLITCNPGGFDLTGLRGVYYARRDVVVPPYDGNESFASRWRSRGAGTIWELTDHP